MPSMKSMFSVSAFVILSSGIMVTDRQASAEVNVVASIKPVHSLVAGVMAGVSTPELIIEGSGSPHTYALKPSQARQLQDADLIFWVGNKIEPFLEKSIAGIASEDVSVALSESHGLTKIKLREGADFEAHDDHDHADHDDDHDDGHEDHDDDHDDRHEDHDEGHDDHDDHADHADHDDHDEGHDDHDDSFDQHVWLDPVNAKAMVHTIEEALVKADPGNATLYEANAARMMTRLDILLEDVNAQLEPVKGEGYIVFHDAYQYYEKRFGITAIGSITVSPEHLPGAKRVSELQEKVRSLNAVCVFSEPQFEPKLVSVIVENTDAGTGVLDPLGAMIESGPDMYFALIRNMTTAVTDCLSGK